MRDFTLTEYEYSDIAELLATIPTKTETVEKEKVEVCHVCKEPLCVVYDQDNECVDTMDRQFITELVERIGDIYDTARGRAILDSVKVEC